MDGKYCIIATQSLEIAGMTLESKVRKGVQLNCIALLSVLAQPFVASWVWRLVGSRLPEQRACATAMRAASWTPWCSCPGWPRAEMTWGWGTGAALLSPDAGEPA